MNISNPSSNQPKKKISLKISNSIKNVDFLAQFYNIKKNATWKIDLENNLYVLTNNQTKISLKIDLQSGNYKHRNLNKGNEPLLKAIKIQNKLPNTIIDTTPGVLKDSFLMASNGIKVTAIERCPILYFILKKSLAVVERDINLIFGNSIELLEKHTADLIYLDPMYPKKNKSALVKKDMQILQLLLEENLDLDADLLLKKAISQNSRTVVKRPTYAEYLADIKPDFSSLSKNTRFDIYL